MAGSLDQGVIKGTAIALAALTGLLTMLLVCFLLHLVTLYELVWSFIAVSAVSVLVLALVFRWGRDGGIRLPPEPTDIPRRSFVRRIVIGGVSTIIATQIVIAMLGPSNGVPLWTRAIGITAVSFVEFGIARGLLMLLGRL